MRAYFSGLFPEGAKTTLRVEVDHELALDWTMNTILYRISQEAIHNVWRHADASQILVTVSWTDDTLVLVIADDGRGFDPYTVLYESGVATMRLFAGLGRGSVRAERADDGGTRIIATFGGGDPVDVPPLPRARGHLYVVADEGTT